MSDPTALTSRTYDRVAAEYHDRRLDRSHIQTKLDQLCSRLAPSALVLDLGCGPGFDSAAMRQRGHRVLGIDLSQGMIRFARRQYPGPYIQADMRHLPLGQKLDAVWAAASLLHLTAADFPVALGECFRILKSGGYLSLHLKAGEGENWENGRFSVDAPRFFTYWTDVDLDRALAETGFVAIQDHTLSSTTGHQTWLYRLVQKPA